MAHGRLGLQVRLADNAILVIRLLELVIEVCGATDIPETWVEARGIAPKSNNPFVSSMLVMSVSHKRPRGSSYKLPNSVHVVRGKGSTTLKANVRLQLGSI